MNGGEPSVWSVVSVSAPDLARTERGPAAVQHAEWVRLFLGRALAPARLVGQEHAPSAVEYLISGIEVSGSLHRDDAACIEAASAVATDFEGLRDVIAYHRDRIERCAQDPNNVPLELFLTTYPMLMCVTVSDDPADWRVTDQGLCIVRWGLRGPRHRPLLQWSAQELQALQRRVIAAAGMPDVAPGEASYSRVAKSAWKVIKDDDEQQRVQKVGDRPKITGGESKAASGKPEEANPSPVAARAAWMAWLETGLIVLALAAAGAGWWWDHRDLSANRDNLQHQLDERGGEKTAAERRESAAKERAGRLESQLNACNKDRETEAKALKTAELDKQAAEARATGLERLQSVEATELKALKEQLGNVRRDLNDALNNNVGLKKDLVRLSDQLSAARASGGRASEQPVAVSSDPKSPGTTSATEIAPQSERPPVPAPVRATPVPPKDSNSGPAVTPMTGQTDPLGVLLQDLVKLYTSPAAGSNFEAFQQSLSRFDKGLDQEQKHILNGWTDSYLENVRGFREKSRTPEFSLRGSAQLDPALWKALDESVTEFLKHNARIKIALTIADFRTESAINEGGWYWIALGRHDKDLEALRKRLGTIKDAQIPPVAGSPNGDKWYRFVTELDVSAKGSLVSPGQGKMYALPNDAPRKYVDPMSIMALEWPSRPRDGGDTAKATLEDLVKLFRSVADNVQWLETNGEGAKQANGVFIPVVVACEFAKSSLSKSSPLCTVKPVQAWLDHLVEVLDERKSGQPVSDRDNMRNFQELLKHPPFFPAGKQNAFTTTFLGALSVSGEDIKIVQPIGATDGKLKGDLAAYVGGMQFQHIGYLEDGKPVFDASAELESLLGCAVFVVEPKQK